MSENNEAEPSADFIHNWIEIQNKNANPEIFGLIVSHLSGVNMDQLDEENLLKDLLDLATKKTEK